jgi:hypothetical protein
MKIYHLGLVYVVLISLSIAGILYVYESKMFDVSSELEELDNTLCHNFNGRAFLLTGGSSKPQTIDEVNYEMNRLNWLCNGAPMN